MCHLKLTHQIGDTSDWFSEKDWWKKIVRALCFRSQLSQEPSNEIYSKIPRLVSVSTVAEKEQENKLVFL